MPYPMVATIAGKGNSAFTPASIPGLKLWLDASTITGLVDGDPVGTWSDLSGNGNHATQATASKKPTLKTSILNGLAVVRLDGVDDLMVLPNFSSAQQGAVWIVYKLASLTSTRDIFTSSDEATATIYWGCRCVTAATGKQSLFQRNADTEDSVRADTTTLTTTASATACFSSDGATSSIWLNGLAQSLTVTSGANTGDWWGDTAGRDNFAIGGLKRTTEGDQAAVDIGEIVVSDQTPSAALLVQMQAYLKAKWGSP